MKTTEKKLQAVPGGEFVIGIPGTGKDRGKVFAVSTTGDKTGIIRTERPDASFAHALRANQERDPRLTAIRINRRTSKKLVVLSIPE